MRPLFADPKTDFVFRKIFGSEEHKPLLIALLNGLLELDEAHRVVEVHLLSRLRALRASIRNVLRARGMTPGPHEEAMLEGCTDLGPLERWLDQALTASSAAEALTLSTLPQGTP